MEGWKITVEEKKRTSFGSSLILADDKIKLIDMVSEDDDFLVASPFSILDKENDCGGFRLSDFGNSQEVETISNRQQNLFCAAFCKESSRPSLAWDAAFFNSSGVLDQDELSIIHKGFKTTQDNHVNSHRSDIEYTSNAVMKIGSSSGHKLCPNCVRIKHHKQTADRKCINALSADKMAKEKTSRKEVGAVVSPRLPKTSRRMSNKLMMPNKKDLVGKGEGAVFGITSTASSVPSTHKFVTISSPQTCSSYLKRKTQSRRIELSASLSTSEVIKAKGNTNILSTTSSFSYHSKIGFDTKKKSGEPSLHNYDKEALNLERDLQNPSNLFQETRDAMSPAQFSSHAFRRNLKPSGLRPPSPNIGFFNEKTPPSSCGVPKTRRKTPLKVSSAESSFDTNAQFGSLNTKMLPDSAIKKLKTPCPEVTKNIKRSKTAHTHISLVPYKVGIHPNLDDEKRKGTLKNKRGKDTQGTMVSPSKQENGDFGRQFSKSNPCFPKENGKRKICTNSGNELGNLSRYFEAIDLNQENQDLQLSISTTQALPSLSPPPTVISVSNSRTPLADKTSIFNYSKTAIDLLSGTNTKREGCAEGIKNLSLLRN